MARDIENSQVIGDYYPEPQKAEPDPDEAYERYRDQLDKDKDERQDTE
jgi:hypothetical protein